MPRPRGLDAAAKKLMQAKAGLKRLTDGAGPGCGDLAVQAGQLRASMRRDASVACCCRQHPSGVPHRPAESTGRGPFNWPATLIP